MIVEANVLNVPAYANSKSGYMVVRVMHGEMWFYGLYDDISRAESAVVEIGNGIILEKK